MSNYDAEYEEYKKALLQDHWFKRTLHEKYRGSIDAEKDYVDSNGVLWKIGALGAACGFCIAFLPVENGNWILGIILFFAIIGSLAWARHIGAKFKKNLGETIFYAFRYHQHFEDRVQEEKDTETKKLLEDIFKALEYSRFRDDISSLTKKDLEKLFLRVIEDTAEFKTRYQNISNYDCFAGSLKKDYNFNAEMQKNIDKYI